MWITFAENILSKGVLVEIKSYSNLDELYPNYYKGMYRK